MSGESKSGDKRPATCENPEADCRRTPEYKVNWADDYTSDNPQVSVWMCEQCSSILERGTVISPNELTIHHLGPEDNYVGDSF